MELADLSGHPARTVARRHKQAVEAWYTELLSKAGVPSPVERARELAVLAEGATSLILVHGDRSYAEVAARAAKQLVRDVEPTKNRQDVKALSHRVVKRKKIR
jgi:hypothetical protein